MAGEQAAQSVLTAKIIVIVLVIFAGMVSFVPYCKCLHSSQKNPDKGAVCSGRFLQYSTAFAAGMLLTMSMCHIYPETDTSYRTYLKKAASGASDAGHNHGTTSKGGVWDFRRMLAADAHDDHAAEEGYPLVGALYVAGFSFMLMFDQVIFKTT